MIRNNFPGPAAAAISRVDVDGDVISLDGRDPVWADSELDTNGQIRVRIRRSTSSAADSAISSSVAMTPRHSSLSGAEIYSANTPGRPGAAPPSHDYAGGDAAAMGCKMMSPRLSGYASSEVYSFHPTPRASNFNEVDVSTPVWAKSPAAAARAFRSYSPAVNSAARAVWEFQQPTGQRCKDLGGNGRFPVPIAFIAIENSRWNTLAVGEGTVFLVCPWTRLRRCETTSTSGALFSSLTFPIGRP